MTPVTSTPVPVAQLPFGRRHVYYLTVSSMEQLIGSAVAAVVGVMVPMIVLVGLPHLSSFMQGISAAVSLVGIAVGSMVIGRLSDRQGYLFYFRLCPALIMAGAVIELFAADSLALFLTGMFLAGLGVGGGYSLDSDYISELMPQSRRFICVGIAKSTSAIGFIFGAVGCYLIIKLTGDADAWIYLMLIVGVLGLITFLMRLRWWESPAWLMAHGMPDKAVAAARRFFGDGVTVLPVEKKTVANASWSSLFSRENMPRVILSGIPWACEGGGSLRYRCISAYVGVCSRSDACRCPWITPHRTVGGNHGLDQFLYSPRLHTRTVLSATHVAYNHADKWILRMCPRIVGAVSCPSAGMADVGVYRGIFHI